MTQNLITDVLAIAHHRNGISGAPFTVAIFYDRENPMSRKLAIVFDQPRHCAVLDIDKLAEDDIAFGSNSWRGDCYEGELRQIIAKHKASQGGTTP